VAALREEGQPQVYVEIATESPLQEMQMMEQIVSEGNLLKAYKQVLRNGGSPGIDGMTVKELGPYLRETLLAGTYEPQPVKRVNRPKPGGGVKKLGVPTAVDRLIQQAVLQILQPERDKAFSKSSLGFRPGPSAHQALKWTQKHLRSGYGYTVDMDLEKFFDRVNHDKLLSEVSKWVKDQCLLTLIRSFLKAGVLDDDALHETVEGTPQGGPLSPLLSNLLLDELERELEKRGHRFARYADDCNIYVRSLRAGQRVMESITRYLSCKLKLKVNKACSIPMPSQRYFKLFGRQDFRICPSHGRSRFMSKPQRLRQSLWEERWRLKWKAYRTIWNSEMQ
jgi:RNA-directed DNA polymerase